MTDTGDLKEALTMQILGSRDSSIARIRAEHNDTCEAVIYQRAAAHHYGQARKLMGIE